jgi:hypothetical protein
MVVAYPGPICGCGFTPQNAAAAFDPRTDRWTALAPPSALVRTSGVELSIGNLAVFYGGSPVVDDGDFIAAYRDGVTIDPASNVWGTIPDPAPLLPGIYRKGFAAWSAHGRLYLVGGMAYLHPEPDPTYVAWRDGAVFDLASGAWSALPDAPMPIASRTAVWTGCDALVLGPDSEWLAFRP